jgi:hypothetical protein
MLDLMRALGMQLIAQVLALPLTPRLVEDFLY